MRQAFSYALSAPPHAHRVRMPVRKRNPDGIAGVPGGNAPAGRRQLMILRDLIGLLQPDLPDLTGRL